jgi:hypothetical protein
MPAQLLEITVRSDWQELDQRRAVQLLRVWRAVEIAVVRYWIATMITAQTCGQIMGWYLQCPIRRWPRDGQQKKLGAGPKTGAQQDPWGSNEWSDRRDHVVGCTRKKIRSVVV